MPTKLSGKWNISNLLQITKEAMPNRFEYMERDVPKSGVYVKKVTVYDGLNLLTRKEHSRTKFIIQTHSWPQYYPYLKKTDSRGRVHTYQRTYRHEYETTIQMEELTIYSPIKIRTGADKSYIFDVNPSLIKSKKNPNGSYLSIGDYNISRGVNPDFFFTQSYVRKQEDCLFGRNYAKTPPEKSNPRQIVFATKHEIRCILTLLERGVLRK